MRRVSVTSVGALKKPSVGYSRDAIIVIIIFEFLDKALKIVIRASSDVFSSNTLYVQLTYILKKNLRIANVPVVVHNNKYYFFIINKIII